DHADWTRFTGTGGVLRPEMGSGVRADRDFRGAGADLDIRPAANGVRALHLRGGREPTGGAAFGSASQPGEAWGICRVQPARVAAGAGSAAPLGHRPPGGG